MVYKRNAKMSKRSFPKRTNRVSRKMYSAVSKIVSKQLRKKIEFKSLDDNNTTTSLVSSGVFTVFRGELNYPIQGDGPSNRDGNFINLDRLKMRACVNTTVSALIRMLCVFVPGTNLNEDTGLTSALQIGPNEFLPRYEGKYSVLYDKVISIDPDNKGTILLQKDLVLKGKKVQFNGTTSGDLETGEIWCFLSTDNTTVSAISVDVNTRLYFHD